MVISGCRTRLLRLLSENNIYSPSFEAGEIISFVMGSSKLHLPSEEVTEEQYSRMLEIAERRIKGEPLQYIFGEWEFYGYPFYVGEGVLIPRPETELLVDIGVKYCNKESRVLDLCSGTGCIPISINLKTGADCYAVELYGEAFGYLKKNIALNNAKVTAIQADALKVGLFPGITFDAIFSNPPYLTAAEMEELQKEVSYEPKTALFGGEDGLDFYRGIIASWSGRLRKGGIFAVEIGETQGEAVSAIMQQNGLSSEIIKDYSGLDRVVLGRRL
ncbi:MAG: peptide chain release factor N(5)-glutamine methyltransferase [Ruminiclostridium sp.]